jgi:hypothetical protein
MAMFSDPDTYWHIAAGDLIRNLGALPEFNPWSLLAPSPRWYNIARLWDIGARGLYQQFGWSGIIAANSIIIAAALALIFANALLLSRDGFSAILATLLFSIAPTNPFAIQYQIPVSLSGLIFLFIGLIYFFVTISDWLIKNLKQ